MRFPSAPSSGDLDGGLATNGRTVPPRPESTATRLWLVQGTRAIDPRRTRGGHAPARQLLSETGAAPASTRDRWSGFVSALQRHKVHAALAQLSEPERQVLTLAFVHGHTNREIAAMLSVSASSVGRRLSSGLEKLENEMLRAGRWLSALVLLFFGYMSGRSAIARRLTGLFQSTRWSEFVAVSAAATVTVVALGTVAIDHGRATPARHHPVAAAGAPFSAGLLTASSQVTSESPAAPNPQVHESGGKPGAASTTTRTRTAVTGTTATTDPGCDGNPTSAPPAVPVASHRGSPVTHPSAGGCGPHGVERS